MKTSRKNMTVALRLRHDGPAAAGKGHGEAPRRRLGRRLGLPSAVGLLGAVTVALTLGMADVPEPGGARPPEGTIRDKGVVELGDLRHLFAQTATVTFWVRLNQATPRNEALTGIYHLAAADGPPSHYPWTDGMAYLNTFRQSRVEGITLSDDVDREQWHLVTITTEPGDDGWKFYQNDILVHTAGGEPAVFLDTRSVLGADRSGKTRLDGRLADVRLYNRALEPEEISALVSGEHIVRGLVWPLLRKDLPEYQFVPLGDTAVLGPVELSAPVGEVSYQWYFNDQPIKGANACTLVIPDVDEPRAGTYYVKVDDARPVTPVESARLQLPAWQWPLFHTNLDHFKFVSLGESLQLGPVKFLNPRGQVTYQWYRDGEPIQGATGNMLRLRKIRRNDLGIYHVRVNAMLYFWPPAPIEEGAPTVSVLRDLITIDNASHINVKRLILQEARGAGIAVQNGAHIHVAGCTIRNVGGWGVRMLDSADSAVLGCDVHHTGAGGIHLSGGRLECLTPGNLRAENNHVHHTGLWNPIRNPGIYMIGVGNQARHNLVNHTPHYAIRQRGNNHLIELNELHNVCSMTLDAGAIHTPSGTWRERGNVIRHNFFHHLYGFEGRGNFAVALDDQYSGMLIEGNIFWRVSHAISDGGGRDTKVLNNVIVDYRSAIGVDARGLGWRAWGEPGLVGNLKRMPYQEPPWSVEYPELVGILHDEPMVPKGTVVARNIIYNGVRALRISREAEPYVESGDIILENNLINEDPRFVDAEAGDFRLREDSPAWDIGFEPIPFDEIGLYEDELRASWPAQHEPEEMIRREPIHDFMQVDPDE